MRRWLLWNARCLRGRRCMRVETTGISFLDEDGDPVDPVDLAGFTLVCDFECGRCGTRYRITTILAPDGTPIDSPRMRMG